MPKSLTEAGITYDKAAFGQETEKEAEAKWPELDGEHLFRSEQYREQFDLIITAYAKKDYDGLEKANQTLISELYEDPVLSERRQEDYALFEQEDFSLAMVEKLPEASKINYEFWRRDQILYRSLKDSPTDGRKLAAKLEDQLACYSEDPFSGNNLDCLCMYVLSGDPSITSMGMVLADYLDLVHIAMDTWRYEQYFQAGK